MFPVSFVDHSELEGGDKIIMPPSALDRLTRLHIDYPMLFEITNTANSRYVDGYGWFLSLSLSLSLSAFSLAGAL